MMNVSIFAVVDDLGATVSRVQSPIALQALSSAALILTSGLLADLPQTALAAVVIVASLSLARPPRRRHSADQTPHAQ